jgi:hypothetical protein
VHRDRLQEHLPACGRPRRRHEDAAGDRVSRQGDRDHVRRAHDQGAYPTLQTPSRNIPISERPGWGKDFADPLTFFTPLFNGRTIIPNGNTNYSLVGITPAQCVKLHIKGDCRNVPSVDPQIDKCAELLG